MISTTKLLPCIAAALLLAAAPASGQRSISALTGIVQDSIRGGPLAGATILVSGTSRMGFSDSTGRFTIDSIPVGDHALALFHPLLDSLSVGVATQKLRFGPDSMRAVVLGTPSAETILRDRCPAQSAMLGPSAIVGRVVDGESGDAVAGARASLVWEPTDGLSTGRRVPRMRAATTNAGGDFVICGLPADLEGTLQVEHGTVRSPELPITLASELLKIRGVGLARAPVPDQPRGTASIAGRIVGPEGRPVANVAISLEGTDATAISDSAGSFTMTALPAGSWVVRARLIGFKPSEAVLELAPGARATVRMRLGERMTELQTVVTEAAILPGLERVGFGTRKTMGMGRFLTSADIAGRSYMETADIFRGMAGVRVVHDGRGGSRLEGRGGGEGTCVSVFVDGFHSPEAEVSLNTALPLQEISAVEVYTAMTRPDQFTVSGRTNCSAVVLWSKTRTGER